MDEGYILSNKFRRIIFNEFVSGEKNINRIAKKNRIVIGIVKKIVDDFIIGGIVEKTGDNYSLTKKGEKLIDSVVK